jgi:hypothetical protein
MKMNGAVFVERHTLVIPIPGCRSTFEEEDLPTTFQKNSAADAFRRFLKNFILCWMPQTAQFPLLY